MKSILTLVLLIGFASSIFAQTHQRPLLNFRETLVQAAPTAQLVPLTETDSTYDFALKNWQYAGVNQHQYYTSDCRDSVVTYSFNGVMQSRIILKYDEFGNLSDELSQFYNAGTWTNSAEYLQEGQYSDCLLKSYLILNWNGASWDTTYGLKEDVVYLSNGLPSVRVYSYYKDSAWIKDHEYVEYYDSLNRLISDDRYSYDAPNNNFVADQRTTNIRYSYYNSWCDNLISSLEYQYYTNGIGWQNSSLDSNFILDNNGSIATHLYTWNNGTYTKFGLYTMLYDAHKNFISEMDQYWDTASKSYSTNYEKDLNYTYGSNGEILRLETSDFNCSPNYDTLLPCSLKNFSNFQTCLATAIAPVNMPDQKINIFPNPARNNIILSISELKENTEVFIYDVTGKLVERFIPNSINKSVNISSLKNGIYFLKIKSGNQFSVKKLEVAR